VSGFSYADLERAISPTRAGRYLTSTINPSTGEADPDRAVALYDFNSRLSAAAWSTVADVEVVLRNALAKAIATLHSTRRPDSPDRWYDGPPWFHTGQWFTDKTLKAIKQAMRRAKDPGPGVRSRPGEGRVIAEFNLGFWRYLLIARYEHSLWNPAMRARFPALSHLSGADSRKAVHGRVEQLNYLRNRIAHHEPIYEPFFVPGHTAPLDSTIVLRDAIELVAWSNATAAAWINDRATFATDAPMDVKGLVGRDRLGWR
jgi:hypothetical protein